MPAVLNFLSNFLWIYLFRPENKSGEESIEFSSKEANESFLVFLLTKVQRCGTRARYTANKAGGAHAWDNFKDRRGE